MVATLDTFARVPRVLRLNVAGHPVDWVSWQEAVCLYARDIVIWTMGDAILHLRGGHNRLDGSQSELDVHSIIACNGKVVPAASGFPPLTNQALFGRDLNMCLYCGGQFSDAELTRDHVIPISKGGQDRWLNVVAACKRCNHFKGSRLLQDTNLELRALPYVPNFAEYLALTNSGRILADQMDFLRKSFSSNSRLRDTG